MSHDTLAVSGPVALACIALGAAWAAPGCLSGVTPEEHGAVEPPPAEDGGAQEAGARGCRDLDATASGVSRPRFGSEGDAWLGWAHVVQEWPMSFIRIPRAWELAESLVTPEDIYLNRRRFMQRIGLATAGGAAVLAGCDQEEAGQEAPTSQPSQGAGGPPTDDQLPPASDADAGAVAPPTEPEPGTLPDDILALYPAAPNAAFLDGGRPVTDAQFANRFNNFYEFTTNKSRVWELAGTLTTHPWEIEVSGLCGKPGTYDTDELVRGLVLEERIYRFRCVEAWSMVVPWTGAPLKQLLDKFEPSTDARYVRFLTFNRPDEAEGQRTQAHYPWPYFEGLRMDEAMNDLAMAVTGIYGKPMPNQHGPPIRLITPWKYGFKSIKSIAKIEFTATQPPTFWNTLSAREYDFLANVDPAVPHPRWSQATERDIGNNGERIETFPYNGYAEQVASLYG
jgi:sulfoxide reductase catalytic subunit YedY